MSKDIRMLEEKIRELNIEIRDLATDLQDCMQREQMRERK